MDRPDYIFAFGPIETGFFVLIRPNPSVVWFDVQGLPLGHERTLLDAIEVQAHIMIKNVEGRVKHFVKADWAASHYRIHTKHMARMTKIAARMLDIVEADEAKMGFEFEDPALTPSSPCESVSSGGAHYSSQ